MTSSEIFDINEIDWERFPEINDWATYLGGDGQVEYTFDNPRHPHARWGRLISGSATRVRLEMIGTGSPKEVRGCRRYQP